MTVPTTSDLPPALAEIVEDFHALGQLDRIQLLLDFSRDLPALPEHLAAHRDLLEPVLECQAPLFLLVEVEPVPPRRIRLFFEAPPEAPTTRGFAGILRHGLDGLGAEQVLGVPDDLPSRLGLTSAVSPLRLAGMAGLLARIKRQVREKSVAA